MNKNDKKVREIVIPGQILGETKTQKAGRGTYIENDTIFSKFVGVIQKSAAFIYVIPLSGVYVPKIDDKIIGIVTGVEKAGWLVDINSPWEAFLSLSEGVDEFVDFKKVDMSKYFTSNDIIYTQIKDFRRGDIQLTMRSLIARKLKGGVLIKITPSKVSRLIGKEGSMVNMIKEKTNTIIRAGQNGIVWISGDSIEKAIKAIKMIDEKSHVYGLTDEISKFLD